VPGVSVGPDGTRIANEDLYGATHSQIMIDKRHDKGFPVLDANSWTKGTAPDRRPDADLPADHGRVPVHLHRRAQEGPPLFREARYILAEEPDLHDTTLYHAVLAAIADGNNTRGSIARYLERKSTDLAHPLGVLHDAGLITHEMDAFRKNRSTYRIAEPLLTFYHAIMRPAWGGPGAARPSRPGLATLQAHLRQQPGGAALRGDLPAVGPLARRPCHLREPLPRPRRQRNGTRPRRQEDAPGRRCRLRPRR
jgi:hypothetical protein